MRTKLSTIKEFFSSNSYAVVGATDDRKKFGNAVYRAMKERHLIVYPVNPGRSTVDGDKRYPSVSDLPGGTTSVVTVVPPSSTEKIISECVEVGIKMVWMQQGSESPAAIKEAESAGITVIRKECVLMFLEPVESGHAFHRWLTKAVHAYPN